MSGTEHSLSTQTILESQIETYRTALCKIIGLLEEGGPQNLDKCLEIAKSVLNH